MAERRKIILIDFDGVIHSYDSGWKGATIISDPPVYGAINWLRRICADERFTPMIYSSRSKEPGGKTAMREWLAKHGFEEDIEMPTTKPPAFLTIDDRAIRFDGMFPDLDAIDAFLPWNKRDGSHPVVR